MEKYRHQALSIRNFKEFQKQALKTFQYQYAHVEVYHNWVSFLGVKPDEVKVIQDIPFLPISVFKSHRVQSQNGDAEVVFKSSGTTGAERSQHFVQSLEVYTNSFRKGFEWFYGDITEYAILALLPSYVEQGESSLVYMVDDLIKKSKNANSGFYLNNYDDLVAKLKVLESKNERTILLGVSYALLDLIEQNDFHLKNTIIMETGGMKGRRKEMVKEELHKVLKEGFGVSQIHSEYGMTELLSQAYSMGNGVFETPPWMKVMIRDASDPLSLISGTQTGGMNVIDLSNWYSCSFVATQDLGKSIGPNQFEIVGRFDHTDIRGCNLLLA